MLFIIGDCKFCSSPLNPKYSAIILFLFLCQLLSLLLAKKLCGFVAAMENGKGEGGGDGGITEKELSAGEAEALNKCLEENKGDHTKCKAKVGAFKSSSSYQKEPSRLPPLRLPSGSFNDV